MLAAGWCPSRHTSGLRRFLRHLRADFAVFPGETAFRSVPTRGAFFAGGPHPPALNRTWWCLSDSAIRQKRLERGQDRPCLLDRLRPLTADELLHAATPERRTSRSSGLSPRSYSSRTSGFTLTRRSSLRATGYTAASPRSSSSPSSPAKVSRTARTSMSLSGLASPRASEPNRTTACRRSRRRHGRHIRYDTNRGPLCRQAGRGVGRAA